MIETKFNGTFATESELMAYLNRSDLHDDCEPSVYVGTYAKYNAGSLKGRWISIGNFDSHEEFMEFCRLYHRDERDPELMFQDYEGFPEVWYTESGMDEETFGKIKRFAGLDDDQREVFEAYCDISDDADFEHCEERYMGQYDSEKDFAYCIVEEGGYFNGASDFLASYFDYEAYARDLFACDFTFSNGHVFRSW